MDTEVHTVVIMAFPDGAVSTEPTPGEGVLAKLHRIARYKRNPRSPEYMRHLVASMLPHARVNEADRAIPPAALAQAPQIVLLWPDATGHGWASLERQVFRLKRREASVYALNGRRRTFRLTAATLFRLRALRLIERLWLGEAAMAVALFISAPFLVAWDLARGHR